MSNKHILFISSDNNRDHGAFLSMAKLAQILQNHYEYQITVILPYEGDGKRLLEEYGIQSIVVHSYPWITDKGKKHNLIVIFKQIIIHRY